MRMAKTAQTLLPVYFFVGEDALKRQVAEDRLKSRIAKLGDIDFNYNEFDGSKCKASDIVEACQTMPFLCDYRYVLVREADGLNAAGAKALCAYIKEPNETTVLALSTSGFDGKSALGKAFSAAPKTQVVDCSLGDVEAIVRSLATGHGKTITPAAAQLLVERVGTDTIHLDTELQKLALAHEGNEPISVQEVAEQVAGVAATEFKPWEFLDAVSAQNAQKCFLILSGVEDDELIHLFSLVQSRIKELIAAQSRSCSTRAALASALGKKDWQVKNHARWAQGFAPGALERACISAVQTEAAMKSGTDKRDAFTDWLCTFFADARNAAYPRR